MNHHFGITISVRRNVQRSHVCHRFPNVIKSHTTTMISTFAFPTILGFLSSGSRPYKWHVSRVIIRRSVHRTSLALIIRIALALAVWIFLRPFSINILGALRFRSAYTYLITWLTDDVLQKAHKLVLNRAVPYTIISRQTPRYRSS